MTEHPEQENFAEASLGEAQSDNPPSDPEMIEDDQDAGPTATGDAVEQDAQRDQAEG